MSTVFHVTTPKKLGKYEATGVILPPVRYWSTRYAASRWMKKTGRTILLLLDEPQNSFPLPIKHGAKWSPDIVRTWMQEKGGE